MSASSFKWFSFVVNSQLPVNPSLTLCNNWINGETNVIRLITVKFNMILKINCCLLRKSAFSLFYDSNYMSKHITDNHRLISKYQFSSRSENLMLYQDKLLFVDDFLFSYYLPPWNYVEIIKGNLTLFTTKQQQFNVSLLLFLEEEINFCFDIYQIVNLINIR